MASKKHITLQNLYDEFRSHMDRVESSLGTLDTRVGNMESRMETMESGMGRMESRLGKVESSQGSILAEPVSVNERLSNARRPCGHPGLGDPRRADYRGRQNGKLELRQHQVRQRKQKEAREADGPHGVSCRCRGLAKQPGDETRHGQEQRALHEDRHEGRHDEGHRPFSFRARPISSASRSSSSFERRAEALSISATTACSAESSFTAGQAMRDIGHDAKFLAPIPGGVKGKLLSR